MAANRAGARAFYPSTGTGCGQATGRPSDWRRDHQLWVELFVLFNFGGLMADIFLAHSQNHFHRASEYGSLYFSIAATLTLAVVVPVRDRVPVVWRNVGYLVGWLAGIVGLTGVILHLDSRFFY